jgi:hypothetical protein
MTNKKIGNGRTNSRFLRGDNKKTSTGKDKQNGMTTSNGKDKQQIPTR